MVRLALRIFCRRIDIPNRQLLELRGPLLITANHPNSFLDAIIIASLFTHPIHFLARGDAFTKPGYNFLLRLLQMIPVYRLSEGRENLLRNEEAFRRSKEILSANGILLIFIEGLSKHAHVLQTFKKGAARIAIDSRRLPGFRVLPLGIAYDSFEGAGKSIAVLTGQPHAVQEFVPFPDEAQNMRHFNSELFAEINQLICIPQAGSNSKHLILILPAVIGYLLHLPLYTILKKYIRVKTRGTVFYDSVLFGALLVAYPLYLLFFAVLLVWLKAMPVLICTVLCIHPVSAWCAVQVFSPVVRGNK